MPPKLQKTAVEPSKSRDLVNLGPRHVQIHHEAGKRKEGKERATTSRALVLRDGKHGARGTGEVWAPARIMGREKLEILAHDMLKSVTTALATPFNIKECNTIASAQLGMHLGAVALLNDPVFVVESVRSEGALLCHPDSLQANLRSHAFGARMIVSKVHNTYMFASGWKLVCESLQDFATFGFQDTAIRGALEDVPELRQAYFSLYAIVNDLYKFTQHKAGLQAMHSAHYKQYFKLVDGDRPNVQEVVFDTSGLKNAYKSFLDSIVLELLLPDTKFPREILFQLLHDSIEEAPKETKRFPQALYETLGDLSFVSRLLAMLEAPLLGPLMEEYETSAVEPTHEYAEWLAAQELSAAGLILKGVTMDFALEKLRETEKFKAMWEEMNQNCVEVSDEPVEKLWRVKDVRVTKKQWHTTYQFNPKHESIIDSDDEMPTHSRYPIRKMKGGGQPRLAITQHATSDDDMPPLLSVSDSSDDEEDESDEDLEENFLQGESDEEFEYDTDEEDELREQLREAMDYAMATEGFLDAKSPFSPDDTKGNPFIKLLGNLRGRLFTNKTNLGKGEGPSTGPQATAGKSKFAATLEEVEDEDDAAAEKRKKKKKPKKKSKKKTDGGVDDGDEVEEPVLVPQTPVPQTPSATTKRSQAAKAISPKPAVPASTLPHVSTISLVPETAVQSARSYLKSESLLESKNKIKSRPKYADLTGGGNGEERRGLFSRLGISRRNAEDREKKPATAWASRLTRKTKTLMHQLIGSSADAKKGQAPMKWNNFVKIMGEMGFTYVPDTAGSSVRFDPPDSRDDPITFHKPHPDPTLYPVMLKQYGKRLKERYGWTEELFPID